MAYVSRQDLVAKITKLSNERRHLRGVGAHQKIARLSKQIDKLNAQLIDECIKTDVKSNRQPRS